MPVSRRTAFLLVALAPVALGAQQDAAPVAIDTAHARLVREYTSDPRFLPTTVATLPVVDGLPSPQAHFGTIIGAPGVMHHTRQIHDYFRALDAATDRLSFQTLRATEEGREIALAVIADEATMKRLAELQRGLARLADPRTLTVQQAESLIARLKPVYYLNGGLHSPEMGSPETLMELAYRLVASDEPAIRRIRENLVVLINPVSEPDGRDKQVDWYHRFTKGRPDYADGFPRSTPYWGKYVVHDNNRDGIQVTQAVTKAMFDVFFTWHPVVMHDLHESVPLLYVSTGTGPYNETNDPIAISEWQLLANHDVTALSALGVPGVWTWGFFDGWWPGYAMWVATNHNAIGRFYETFGNAGADTYVRDLSDARFAGEAVTSRTWYRAWPPTKKVRWSARDNVNFTQAGVLASLDYAAANGEQLLRNFYRKGVNSWTRGRTTKPYAYVIPALTRQRDPRRAAYLVNQLRRHAIEVHEVAAGDSAGDFVVRLDQPYRDLAVNLLSRQNFPASAQNPPYDDIAWTLGYLYGVEVAAVDDSAVLQRPGLRLLGDSAVATAAVRGDGGVYLLRYRGQGELLPALHWLRAKGAKSRASAAESPFVVGADSFPAGSVVFEGLVASDAAALASRFAFPLVATRTAPAVPRHALDLPRLAVFHTWYDTQDEGWARYTLEQHGVPYASIDKDDLRRGNLKRRFDVILVPQVRGDLTQMIHEHDLKWGPMPYGKAPDTPGFATAPASTPDMTGGMGFEGLAELRRFVDAGGTLVTLGNATRLAAGTGIARPLNEREARTLFHPGSVVRARARSAHSPILYGYPESFQIFRGNGPLFQVPVRDSTMVVLQFGMKRSEPADTAGPMMGLERPRAPARPPASQDSATADTAAAGRARKPNAVRADSAYVLSGMVRAQEEIVGQGAIFDVPVGRGRVVAFGFNPLHRYLNHHEFPLVWNTLLNWNDRPGPSAASQGARVAAQP